MYSLPLDVLVVSEAEETRDALLRLLGQESACQTVATDWNELWRVLRSSTWDALLLDLETAQAGTEVLGDIAREAPDPALVGVTRDRSPHLGLAALRQGAEEHVSLEGLAGPELYRILRYAVERRRAEQTLRQALAQSHQAQKMEALGRVAAGLTHDFRNLVTVILGNCQILKRILPGEERLQTPVDEINLAGQKASNLVSQLLNFARDQKRELSVLDLGEALANLQPLVQPLLANRVRGTVVPASVPLPVRANATSLDQIVMNLVVNAVDAMGSGGRLFMSASRVDLPGPVQLWGLELRQPAYAVLTVADDGPGMPPEVLARVFEPFFTTKPRGTGLGLSSAYALAREMGGEMAAFSRLGQGSAFRLLLPLEGATAGLPAQLSGSVLLVSSEVPERVSLRSGLERMGLDVLEARTGAEVERMGSRKTVDLVLVDLDALEEPLAELLPHFPPGARRAALTSHPFSSSELALMTKPLARADLARLFA